MLRRTAYWSLLGAFVLTLWVIYFYYPKDADDWWYSKAIYEYLEGIDTTYPWRRILDAAYQRYLHDNGRFANVVALFALTLPKWLAAMLPPAATGLATWLIARSAGGGSRRIPILVATILCISWCWPWHEVMFTIDFSLNYVVPSGIAVLYIYCLLRKFEFAGSIAFFSALLLGAWHEGFGVPLMCATGAWALVKGVTEKRWPLREIVCTLAFIPGTLWLLSSPYVQATQGDLSLWMVPHNFIRGAKLHMPFLFYLLFLAVAVKKRGAKELLKPINLFVVICCIIGIALTVQYPRGYRTGWISFLMASWGIVYLLPVVLPRRWTTNSRYGLIASAAIIALLAVHYIVVINDTKKMARTTDEVVASYRSNPGEPVYIDMMVNEKIPLISWRKPRSNWFNRWGRGTLANYFDLSERANDLRGRPDVNEGLVLLPKSLRGKLPDEGRLVPGTAHAYEFDGLYFTQLPMDRYGKLLVTKTGPFSKAQYFDIERFKDKQGRNWIMMMPENSFFPSFLFKISQIDTLGTPNSNALLPGILTHE